ncbi:MAG: hypothetical protein AB7E96_10635 [Deferribacterales bacterium]
MLNSVNGFLIKPGGIKYYKIAKVIFLVQVLGGTNIVNIIADEFHAAPFQSNPETVAKIILIVN